MKKTFKHFLMESQKLSHWPKTSEELEKAYMRVCIESETGEVMMPPITNEFRSHDVKFNDDLTVSIGYGKGSDRVQIQEWMLVDGHMPFPFKEVLMSVDVERDCKLKSLIGLPKKCLSLSFEYGALDNSVKNFVGGPEEVDESFSVKECGIESTLGMPTMGNHCSVFFNTSGLKDFSHIPKKVENLTIGESKHFTHEDFKYLPESANLIAFSVLPNLKSLHNLHKYVTNLHVLGIFQTKIQHSILPLAMINGLSQVDPEFFDVNDKTDGGSWPADGVEELVIKYAGSHDLFEFQEELLDLGLTELAKL